jgi:hypothetical protein
MSDELSEENLALLDGLASRKPRPRRSAAEDDTSASTTGEDKSASRGETQGADDASIHSGGFEEEAEQPLTPPDDTEDAESESETTQKIVLPSFRIPGLDGIDWRTWQNAVIETLLAVVLAVGLLSLTGLSGSESRPPVPVMPDAEIMIVCPGFAERAGTILGSVTGTAEVTPVSGGAEPIIVSGNFELPDITQPMMITAARGDSALNARFVIYQAGEADADPAGDRVSEMNCVQPLASQYLLFPSSSGAVVQLVNPDDTEAVFNVTALGADGQVALSGMRDLRLAPHSTTRIEVGKMLATPAALTLRITNTTGRLLATGDVEASLGAEFSTATQLGRDILITGIPVRPNYTRVMLANPATVRVSFSMVALFADGTRDIAGAKDVTLEAESTTVFDVAPSLVGEPAAILITANNDIAAAAAVSIANDFAMVAGVPLTQLIEQTLLVGVMHPAQLMLANPNDESMTAEVQWVAAGVPTSELLTVEAHSSVLVDVPEEVELIRLLSPEKLGSALLLGTASSGQATLSLPAETQSAGRTPLRIVAQR